MESSRLALQGIDMFNESGPLAHDAGYLSRREAQERAAADQALDPAARVAHTALADRYAERLRAVMPVPA